MELCSPPPAELSILALHAAVKSQALYELDTYTLYLLVPRSIHDTIATFQLRFLVFLRRKMERELLIQKILSKASMEEILRPVNLQRLPRDEGVERITSGDHIVVFTGFVYHHGVYLGNRKVADNNRGRKQSIQEISLDSFLGTCRSFGIVSYQLPSDVNEDEYRKQTILIAKYFIYCKETALQKYNLLSWNCECFALCCVTHGFLCESEQVKRVYNEIVCDPRFRREVVDWLLTGVEGLIHFFGL
jgi:hypothetical protein